MSPTTRYFRLVEKLSRCLLLSLVVIYSQLLFAIVQVNIFELTVRYRNVTEWTSLYVLSNEEFVKETGAWVHDSASSLLESKDLFQDIIPSPEKTDDQDCNESLASEFIESNYHSVKQCGRRFYDISTRTNIGKQSVSSIVVDLWQDLPTSLKNLNTFTFPGKLKEFLLKTQSSK